MVFVVDGMDEFAFKLCCSTADEDGSNMNMISTNKGMCTCEKLEKVVSSSCFHPRSELCSYLNLVSRIYVPELFFDAVRAKKYDDSFGFLKFDTKLLRRITFSCSNVWLL